MPMLEQLRTPGSPLSAHEINRRVRQIERDQLFSAVTPWSGWEADGAAPAQTKSQVVYNNGISPTTTTGNTNPSSGRPHKGSAQSRPASFALFGENGEAQLVTRGWQRTPKPWLKAGLCRLGIHEGPWAYVAGGNCTQGRECGRCGSVHARTKHRQEWRYDGHRSCSQVWICSRCNRTKVIHLVGGVDVPRHSRYVDAPLRYRTRHENWSEAWDAGGDKMAHLCLRCGVVEKWTVSDGD